MLGWGRHQYDHRPDELTILIKDNSSPRSNSTYILYWEALDSKRACRISKVIEGGGWQDEDSWPEVHGKMVDAMIRLEKALRPHLS